MLRVLAARFRNALAFDRRIPPPTLGFELAGGNHSGFFGNNEIEEDHENGDVVGADDEMDDGLLMAVPKRRVTRRRKRIKFAQKHLTPLKGFVTCPGCGQQHPHYYQLCPFCKPFNNYIRTKDVPARSIDRLKRDIEVKLLNELLEKEKAKEARIAEAAKKYQETLANKQAADRVQDVDKDEKR